MKRSVKRILAVVLVLAIVFAIAGCKKNPPVNSGNSASQSDDSDKNTNSKISADDLLGEWYDVKTAQNLVFNSNGNIETRKSYSGSEQPGYWNLKGDTIEMTSVDIKEDLTVSVKKNVISLVNDTFEFRRWKDLPTTKVSMGETAQDSFISLKVNSVDYCNQLPESISESSTFRAWGNSDEYALGNGMVYAKISFDITNLTQTEIKLADNELFNVILDYNDGFRFATYHKDACYFETDSSEITILDGSGGVNVGIPVLPLETKAFDLYLECPATVSTDSKGKVNIDFISSYGTEALYYEVAVN